MNWLKTEKGTLLNTQNIYHILVDYDAEGFHVCAYTRGTLTKIKSKFKTERAATAYIDQLLVFLNDEEVMI